MSIAYRGERFEGYNQPKRTPGHATKSHAVLAKDGNTVRLIRFGQQGVKGAGSNPDSDIYKKARNGDTDRPSAADFKATYKVLNKTKPQRAK